MSEFIFDDFITEIDSLEVKAPGTAFEKLPAGEHNVEIQKAQVKEYDDDVKIGLLIASVGGRKATAASRMVPTAIPPS